MSTRTIYQRALKKSQRVLLKWRRAIFPLLPQRELFPSDVILHFGYHRCLTVYYEGIFSRLSKEFNFSFQNFFALHSYTGFEQAVVSGMGKRVVGLDNVSDINFAKFPGYKGSHFVRDPRDLIVSGYHYHLWTDEPRIIGKGTDPKRIDWEPIIRHPYFLQYVENERNKFPNNISYQEYLKSLDVERGLILEILWWQSIFEQMQKWQLNPLIIELKFEEIVGNEVEAFRKVFDHYEFHPKLKQRGLEIVDELSIKNQPSGERKHIRSGKPAQWKVEFTPLMKEVFRNLYGNLLIQFGYEQGNDW